MRAHDAQVCHAHGVMRKNGHTRNLFPFPGETVPQIVAETAVDLFENPVDTRQSARDQVLRPRFESLGKNGMICVSARRRRDIPRNLPIKVIFVHEDAHQLGNCKRGMRIVDVDCRHLRQKRQRTVTAFVVGDDTLQRRRNEEILLFETERLPFVMVIGRIKNFGNKLRVRIVAHDFGVISLREKLHIELLHGAGTPQAQRAHRFGILSGNHHVVSDRLDFFGVVVHGLHAVIRPLFLQSSVKTDDKPLIRPLDQPRLPSRQPDVGQFDLPAVDDLLFEEPVLIADGKAHRGIVLCCESVQKTRGKPTESPVSESRVGFLFVEIFQSQFIVFERAGNRVVNPEIIDAVFQRTPHQKFHAKIIDALCFGVLCFQMKFLVLFRHNVAYAHHDGAIDLLSACFLRRDAEITRQLPRNKALCFLFGQLTHECNFISCCCQK